jgi:hypothetical protein
MRTGGSIGLGAVTGLAVGVVVSVTTDLPAAPEGGLLLGVLGGWLLGRKPSESGGSAD